MITIALPNHASRIAWLAMESLCNQITQHEWELIVYEDSDIHLGGEQFYRGYTKRLEAAGMTRLVYIYSKERVPLSMKWLDIASVSDKDSLGMILQASDCYSEPQRIDTAVRAFRDGADWIQSPLGCFYHIKTGQMMLFKMNGLTGLNMAISKRAISQIEPVERWSGVDWWLYDSLPDDAQIYIDESDNWKRGIDTDGHNRISLSRRTMYDNPQPPFYKTNLIIQDLIPYDTISKL